MQFGGMLRLQRALLALSQKSNCQCTAVVNFKALKSENSYRPVRHFYATPIKQKELEVQYTNPQNIGLMQKFLLRLGLKNSRLMAIAYLTYEALVDKIIEHEVFYKELNMPDTMLSWFLVTELYVWLVMVRYMAEGEDGILLRNALSTAMWEDVTTRVNKLGHIKGRIKKNQLIELNAQFNAALLSYDEGIMSDDKVLANALWRRIMQSDSNNAEVLEKLVIFVRKQLQLLDAIPSSILLSRPRLKWIDYKTVKPF